MPYCGRRSTRCGCAVRVLRTRSLRPPRHRAQLCLRVPPLRAPSHSGVSSPSLRASMNDKPVGRGEFGLRDRTASGCRQHEARPFGGHLERRQALDAKTDANVGNQRFTESDGISWVTTSKPRGPPPPESSPHLAGMCRLRLVDACCRVQSATCVSAVTVCSAARGTIHRERTPNQRGPSPARSSSSTFSMLKTLPLPFAATNQ